MRVSRLVPLAGCALLLALGACASRTAQAPMPVREFKAPAPTVQPSTAAVTPVLVSYPGIEVEFVSNAESETYHYRGTYYTYFDNAWFRARTLRGPWKFIEMKYVPSDLFRVRGHVPPGVDR